MNARTLRTLLTSVFVVLLVAQTGVTLAWNSKDLPVHSGGEGYTGCDWRDTGMFTAPVLWYWDDATSQGYPGGGPVDVIGPENTNFVGAHAQTSTGTKCVHYHFLLDYGETKSGLACCWGTVSGPSIAAGNKYWDWIYEGYSPAVVREEGPTDKINCIAYSLDGYKSGASVDYWVCSGSQAKPLFDELAKIADPGINGGFDTITGDRCYRDPDHVWNVIVSIANAPAIQIRWKNGASGIYSWAHETGCTNDAPNYRGSLYQAYAIYNTVPR
jgi:hypothetical protein